MVKINVSSLCTKYEHPTLLQLNDFDPVFGTGTYHEHMYEEDENHSKSVCVYGQTTFTIIDDRDKDILTVKVYNSTPEMTTTIANLIKKEIEHYDEIVQLKVS